MVQTYRQALGVIRLKRICSKLGVVLHLRNIIPPIGKHGSAMWEIVELPGVMLHNYPSTSPDKGWRIERWEDFISDQAEWVLDKLRGQIFRTRKEALEIIEMTMDMHGEQDG